MQRRAVEIDGGEVLAYGHYGRPVVVFPSENGEVHDWEAQGMIDVLSDLLDAGRLKLYCIPSFDRASWTRGDLPLEERAQRHGHYEWWVLTRLVPFVQADSHTPEVIVTGASFGA
ncbi:MAG TPA: hypothetical protein VHV52_00535, partial [Gaiellaceae bacterium]|nr:hypothetical protein [Gaiellaceae bacterium]